MGLRSPRADLVGLVLLAGLGGLFAIFFVLPFLGLGERAASDGRVWELATSEAVRRALTLSLWTSLLSTLLAVIFGTPVAYWLSRTRVRGRALLEAAVDLPIVLPPTVAGVALLTAFGARGLVGEPLAEMTGIRLTFTATAVVMAQLLVAAPFYVRAARSGFAAVDPQLERVAYTLGASRVETFLRITVPQARGALLAGIVLCWARALGELGATLIFAGSLEGRTRTMPLAIIDAFERTSLGLSGAVSMSLILLVVAFVVLVLFRLATPDAPDATAARATQADR
ncbi:MAG: ABC transporter permease [Dehalococcoidia bacterium]|nr:ABC transporter permease [Dehalococcoidia bacterium]